jgi:hypothetical protein
LAETANAVRTAGQQYAVTDTAAADRFTAHHSLPL